MYPWVGGTQLCTPGLGTPWVGGTQLCTPGLGTPRMGGTQLCTPGLGTPWMVPNCVCVSADVEFPSARVSSLRFMGTACYSSFVLYTCSVGTLYPLNAQPGLVHIYFAVLNLGILQLLQRAGRRG